MGSRGQPVVPELLPFPAVLLDKRGVILEANALLCSLSALSPETLRGRPMASLFPSRQRRQLMALLDDAGAVGVAEGKDFSMLTGEGSTVPVWLWLGIPSRDSAMGTEIIAFVRDASLEHRDYEQMKIYAGELKELYKRTKEQVAELTLLNNISGLINTSTDTREIVKTTIESLRRFPWARSATITVGYFDSASNEWCRFSLSPDGLKEQRLSQEVLPERALAQLFGRRRCLLFPDITHLPRPSSERLRCLLPQSEVKGLIALPLVGASRVFGAILVASQGPLNVSGVNRRLLHNLSNQVSMAVHHSLLFQEAYQRGSQTMQLLKALHLLASSLNLSTVLEQLLSQVATIASGIADSVAIALSTDTEGRFRVVSLRSNNGKLATPGLPIVIAPELYQARGLTVVPDMTATLPQLKEHLPKGLDLAATMAPIFLSNSLLGFILVFYPKGSALSVEQEKLLGGLADYASIAIDNAQRYALERERTVRTRQLEQAMAELLPSLAHELKTPLTSIRVAVDILSSPSDSRGSGEEEALLLASLRRSADRLDGVVNGMQDATTSSLSVPGLMLPGLKFQVVDVLGVVEDTTRIMAPIFVAKQQKFDLRHPGTRPLLLADRQAIQQVLINLLSNASKFAAPDTAISLNIQCSKGWLRFCVKDQGPGIPKEAQDSIFQGKRVAARGQAAQVGQGLGLPAVKALVELHGGRVWVRSQPGKGSRFYYTLPLGGHYEDPGSGR